MEVQQWKDVTRRQLATDIPKAVRKQPGDTAGEIVDSLYVRAEKLQEGTGTNLALLGTGTLFGVALMALGKHTQATVAMGALTAGLFGGSMAMWALAKRKRDQAEDVVEAAHQTLTQLVGPSAYPDKFIDRRFYDQGAFLDPRQLRDNQQGTVLESLMSLETPKGPVHLTDVQLPTAREPRAVLERGELRQDFDSLGGSTVHFGNRGRLDLARPGLATYPGGEELARDMDGYVLFKPPVGRQALSPTTLETSEPGWYREKEEDGNWTLYSFVPASVNGGVVARINLKARSQGFDLPGGVRVSQPLHGEQVEITSPQGRLTVEGDLDGRQLRSKGAVQTFDGQTMQVDWATSEGRYRLWQQPGRPPKMELWYQDAPYMQMGVEEVGDDYQVDGRLLSPPVPRRFLQP